MRTYVLKENTLSNNTLLLASKGKVFKGQYVAILKEYNYATPWTDKESIKRFKTAETLLKYLDKYYPEFEETSFK